MRFRISIISIFFFWGALQGYTQSNRIDPTVELTMRMIGHEVLLHAGDSSSLVLPIERSGRQYIIPLAASFAFHPDELVKIIDSTIFSAKISEHYLVSVEQCLTREIVYSYSVGYLPEAGMVPCKSRTYPEDCYNLLITLLDAPDTYVLTSGSDKTDYLSLGFLILLVLLLIGGAVYYWQKKMVEEPGLSSDLIPIGKYQYDKKNMELCLGEEKTELTGKEADLLLLLHASANTTLERDDILNVVWGDKGSYVGRTLDVFISKLRKKLEADPGVKIANIRGVGYRLVLNEERE